MFDVALWRDSARYEAEPVYFLKYVAGCLAKGCAFLILCLRVVTGGLTLLYIVIGSHAVTGAAIIFFFLFVSNSDMLFASLFITLSSFVLAFGMGIDGVFDTVMGAVEDFGGAGSRSRFFKMASKAASRSKCSSIALPIRSDEILSSTLLHATSLI